VAQELQQEILALNDILQDMLARNEALRVRTARCTDVCTPRMCALYIRV
jgi:hypothetical protein